ncbi:MAG: 2-amino-4-hydroxy-6-hydroxymethyldihydropteridine diphosphokinase [Fimbriimonadaceae bacterium]|nr:2-amino-4-hydroxy-6-hydroxymethyldihydropteridine diphosphokinase [Chitinophagales bacterium]
MQHNALILLGTNLGNRQQNLMAATGAIRTFLGSVEKQSHIYESEPWGRGHQPMFYNQALQIVTPCTALETLHHIKQIEFLLGRERKERWAPRTIDIDILFFDDLQVESPILTIPHPQLHLRKFTLDPLNEMVPDYMHPVLKKTIAELWYECEDVLKVTTLDLAYQY